MKNVRLLTVLIALIVVLSLTFAVTPAFAEGSSSRADSVDVYSAKGYELKTIRSNGNVIGVEYKGYYFSAGGIEVNASIYSDTNFTIDFPINEADANLTPSQLEVKQKLLTTAEAMHKFITHVDEVANTQYDGSGKLPTSDVYRYNMAECGSAPIEIDYDTYRMLEIARTMYNDTNGAFNPAVYRLVDLWGFSSRVFHINGNLRYDRTWNGGSYPKPADKYITAFRNAEFIDFSAESVTLAEQDGKYYVTKNVRPAVVDEVEYQQWIDLGGIAKGYVVDGIKDMLSKLGITQYSVDSGSSSQAYGKYYNGASFLWGVSDPYNDNPFFPTSVVEKELSDVTVSTSGQYVRRYVTDGVEYSHIVDGTQGAPAQTGVRSVTIVAPQDYLASMGDCLTTALTVMRRDRIIDFMNGYLKNNDIKIILLYETADAQKQIITNYAKEDIIKGDTFNDYAWAVKIDDNGDFAYDFDAKAPVQTRNLTWLIITLGVIVLLAIVVVVVLYFVKGGRSKVTKNVLNAKRDKPFKLGDIGAYLLVAVLIVALFLAIFGGESKPVNIVKVYDFSNSDQGELLYVYNVSRNEGVIYDNSNGWNIEETKDGNNVTVKFSRTINGEERYDIMTITRGSTTTVKMIDATCPDKACVYNSPAIKSAKWGIVCNPNKLKIISE